MPSRTCPDKRFREYEFVGEMISEDARNAVLFPEKIGGAYAMLYRPNRLILDGGVASGSAIELAVSDDLMTWTPRAAIIKGRFHYWDEYIGSGPPPLKTPRGGYTYIMESPRILRPATFIRPVLCCLISTTRKELSPEADTIFSNPENSMN